MAAKVKPEIDEFVQQLSEGVKTGEKRLPEGVSEMQLSALLLGLTIYCKKSDLNDLKIPEDDPIFVHLAVFGLMQTEFSVNYLSEGKSAELITWHDLDTEKKVNYSLKVCNFIEWIKEQLEVEDG